MSNSFKLYVQHNFPEGTKNFAGGFPPSAPLVTGLRTTSIDLRKVAQVLPKFCVTRGAGPWSMPDVEISTPKIVSEMKHSDQNLVFVNSKQVP